MREELESGDAAKRREVTIGVLCALLVICLYSSFTLVSRLGLTTSLGVFDLAAVRFCVSGILLLPVVLRYRLQHLRLRDAAGLSLLGGFGFALLCYIGFGLAPASHGGVLVHGCLPLFTFILMRFSGAELPSRRAAMGVLLIAAGIAIMAAETISTSTALQLLGDACLLAASLCWSGYGMYAARLKVAPLHAAALVSCLSMSLFLPMYAAWPDKHLFTAPLNDVLVQVVFQGVLIGAGSILIYTRALAALGPARITLFAAAVPGLTTLAAIPLLGEEPSLLSAAGVTATTVGMLVGLSGPRSGDRRRGGQGRLSRRGRQKGQELGGLSKSMLRDLNLTRINALRDAGLPWWADDPIGPRHL